MSTSVNPGTGQPDHAGLPRWLAAAIALFFWVVLLPLVHAGIPWALSLLTPRYGWREGTPGAWNWLGLVPIALAAITLVWLLILHLSRFPRRVKLERTPSYLLVRGPYRITRNPMYIAEMALWLGWAILYGSIPVLIMFLVMGPAMNRRVAQREEPDLEARFGQAYREYKSRVPRWLGFPPIGT